MKKILIIEDDDTIGIGLKYYLMQENFEVELIDNGVNALDKLKKYDADLILLDINLPDYNGFKLFKEIKKIKNYPIIFLTADDLETSIVMGLDMGAEDYITKPFKVRELLSRINATLRRYTNDNQDIIILKDIKIDMKKSKVFKNDIDMNFTALEYKIFLNLALNQNKVITRERILSDIWDINNDYVNDNTLTVYIKRIREKIEDNPTYPKILKTVRGIGYIVDVK